MTSNLVRKNSNSSSILGNQPLYEEIEVIGTGAYGTVYKGYDLKTARIVAMKRIRIQITEEGLPISTIREIAYLRLLEKYDHENIVKLLDVINGPRLASEQSVILIFEFVDHDLDSYLRSFPGSLSLTKIIDLMKQMLSGTDFLHMNRIIHRDLKPQNILITKEGRVKIADFGLARIYGFSMAMTSVVVTLWYRSPEVLLHSTYSSSVDIWSLGCILAELYLKRPLFMGHSDVDQLYKIFEIMGLPNEADWPVNSAIPLRSFHNNTNLNKSTPSLRKSIPNIDDLGFDLLKKLLDFNVVNRITAKDALGHSFFKQNVTQENTASHGNNGNVSGLMANAIDLDDDLFETEATAAGSKLSSLPDITNVFHPNILKRKRNNANCAGNQNVAQNN